MNAVTPGEKTSEFKLAKINQYVGVAMIVLGVVADALQSLSEAFPDVGLISLSLKVVGAILTVGTYLGYAKSRAVVKSAALVAGAPASPKSAQSE